ncbi:spore coat protein [Tuberibacillus calidus]|uniref:spore coat protein n=1 Tax=Tuberibacillus calidus TaxID=340097 RepID=UPI00041B7430|nr:spore coat protein [Tuberibacillus calidus]
MTQVKNPSVQVPETPQMNDRDFLNDCLMTEKYLTTAYSIALHEMSHQALYQDVLAIFQETEQCQRDLYDLMFRKGWYGVEAESPQKVQQAYQKFSQYATNQFSNHGTMQ